MTLIAIKDAELAFGLTPLLDRAALAVQDGERIGLIGRSGTGKSSLLKVGPAFEQRYHVAAALDRNVWLLRDRFQPEYAGRPWSLWTANSALQTNAQDAPVRWLVVQP